MSLSFCTAFPPSFPTTYALMEDAGILPSAQRRKTASTALPAWFSSKTPPEPDKAAHDILSQGEAEYVVAVVKTPDDIRADVFLSPEENIPEAAEKLLDLLWK